MSTDPIFPLRLRRGDTIGLCCPAGPVRDPQRLEAGIRLIETAGFRVKIQGPVKPRSGYLADSDKERARHLMQLWSDPEVKALIAVRGGFGCLRMVDLLDWELIRNEPKLLAGFSDLTVLLGALVQRAGLVAIHGPMAASLARVDTRSQHSLFALLTGELPEAISCKDMEVLRGGISRGRLTGGNLATLCHLLGTPWDADWDGAVLVLEDTNEPLYRLDRMLTQLALAGRLERLAGLVLSDFDTSGDTLENLRLQEAVWSRVLELAGPNYPIWGRFPCGHQKRNLALPLGMEAIMDSSAGVLRLVPDSVRFAPC
ncbi:MAG: S66 peptidase family protein [Desulfobulbus sp.]|jgi:muramoyltetrapeptide carboxypeptidase